MATNIGNLIGTGFKSWWKNLIIILPYLFSSIATSIISVIALLLAFPILKISMMDFITAFSTVNQSSTQLAQFAQQVITNLSNPTTILLLVLLGIVYLALSMFIASYFSSGAIGMANHYLKLNQKPGLKEMHLYAKKFMPRYFFFQLITGFVFLVFLTAFFIPLAVSNGKLIFIILFAIALLIVLVLSFFLMLTPYIIVTKDCSLGAAFKRSFSSVGKNFWSLLGLSVLWALIGSAASAVSFIPILGQAISSLANVLVIEPAVSFSYVLFANERA